MGLMEPICRHILQTERCKLRHQLIWRLIVCNQAGFYSSQAFPPNVKTAGADASHEFLYHLETFAGGTSGLKVPNDMTWPRLMKNQEVVIGLGGGLIFFKLCSTLYTWVEMVSNLTCAYFFQMGGFKNHQATKKFQLPRQWWDSYMPQSMWTESLGSRKTVHCSPGSALWRSCLKESLFTCLGCLRVCVCVDWYLFGAYEDMETYSHHKIWG